MPETTTRIGLIVPSSNVTVETELPQILSRHPSARFSFHGSRMRMNQVSPEELAAMNSQRERCVDELADAGCDALVYGCLVALMAQGPGEHEKVEAAVGEQLAVRGSQMEIVTSAGALVEGVRELGAERVALVTPYLRPLAEKVVGYLEAYGISVTDWVALEEPDNAKVAQISGDRVLTAARGLDLHDAEAVIISACVQMPSLGILAEAEEVLDRPVLSAATASARAVLRQLDCAAPIPGAGALLRR